jgi:hypothetical protein
MWNKILEMKAQAERDLILAQAKIEITTELLASLDSERTAPCVEVKETVAEEHVEHEIPSTIF